MKMKKVKITANAKQRCKETYKCPDCQSEFISNDNPPVYCKVCGVADNALHPLHWSKDRLDLKEVGNGRKDDSQKLRYDLFTREALDQIAMVLTFGTNKYTDRNWEKGISYGRIFGATMRHLWAWWGGETLDKESGISHLAHAGCNIVFLLTYESRGLGEKFDDRGSHA